MYSILLNLERGVTDLVLGCGPGDVSVGRKLVVLSIIKLSQLKKKCSYSLNGNMPLGILLESRFHHLGSRRSLESKYISKWFRKILTNFHTEKLKTVREKLKPNSKNLKQF